MGTLRGKVVFKGTKRPKSRRAIDLDDSILAVLRAHRLRQNERRLALGSRWQDHDLVFPSNVGTPVNGDNCDKDFNRLVKLAGVKRTRIHDTRHSYATLAILSGSPVHVVSQSLGHADVSTTLRTYAHALPQQSRELAERMASLLLKPPGGLKVPVRAPPLQGGVHFFYPSRVFDICSMVPMSRDVTPSLLAPMQ